MPPKIREPTGDIAVPHAGSAHWAERIGAAWLSALASILETGRLLAEAKAALPHGEFLAMIETALPFCRQTAHKLMVIAADKRLSNVAHARHLPPHWGTLYELTKLTDDDVFEAMIASGEIHPEMQRNDVPHVNRTDGTGNDEWFTPPEHLDLARAVLGHIDLDPASHPIAQKTVRATAFFTRADDGLTREWSGRVWLNPPYGPPLIGRFVDKLIEELAAGRVPEAVMLTHAYTDTAWFQKAARRASVICFTRGRVRFVSPEGDLAVPTQGQAFFYFGPDPMTFKSVFGHLGFAIEVS